MIVTHRSLFDSSEVKSVCVSPKIHDLLITPQQRALLISLCQLRDAHNQVGQQRNTLINSLGYSSSPDYTMTAEEVLDRDLTVLMMQNLIEWITIRKKDYIYELIELTEEAVMLCA